MRKVLFLLMVLFNSSLLIIDVWGSGKVSFTSDSTGNLDIYIIDINGKNLVNLTNHPSDDFSPTWSPDGRAFAYVFKQRRESGNLRDEYGYERIPKNHKPSSNRCGSRMVPGWQMDRVRIQPGTRPCCRH